MIDLKRWFMIMFQYLDTISDAYRQIHWRLYKYPDLWNDASLREYETWDVWWIKPLRNFIEIDIDFISFTFLLPFQIRNLIFRIGVVGVKQQMPSAIIT